MIDFLQQRRNMVESQVRPSDVIDRRIIRSMSDVPREMFVPEAARSVAYMDEPVRVTTAVVDVRALMAPRTLAKLLQSAGLEADHVVLDVGCMTGYTAAVLARIVQTVVALESDAALAHEATRVLSALSADNVAVVTGPLARGYPSEGPYDAIVLEGAVGEVPVGLLDQLKDGGRLVGILADAHYGRAVVWQRIGEQFDDRVVFDASAPRLPGFDKAPAFVF